MTSHGIPGRQRPDDFTGEAEAARQREERPVPGHERNTATEHEDVERLDRDESISEETA
jgi:hypothetical protein